VLAVALMDATAKAQEANVLMESLWGKARLYPGALLGLYSLVAVLPALLGIFGGLSRGLFIIHCFLPCHFLGVLVELVVVWFSLPTLFAYLGLLLQLLGDVLLVPAFVLMVTFVALPSVRAYYYCRFYCQPCRYQQGGLCCLDWVLLILSTLCLVAAVACIVLIAADCYVSEQAFARLLGVPVFLAWQVMLKAFLLLVTLMLVTCILASDLIIFMETLVTAFYRRPDCTRAICDDEALQALEAHLTGRGLETTATIEPEDWSPDVESCGATVVPRLQVVKAGDDVGPTDSVRSGRNFRRFSNENADADCFWKQNRPPIGVVPCA